ncbi:MAG TPA: four-helix bundle copper-binding protein [Phycisphaerales bacterium]
MSPIDPKKMEHCAHVCHECQDACLRTIVHCLDLGGEHAAREHQVMLMDCAAICQLSHNFLHRHSSHHKLTCAACAEVCRACAEGCEKLGKEDYTMSECAAVCRRCAESCDRMASETL